MNQAEGLPIGETGSMAEATVAPSDAADSAADVGGPRAPVSEGEADDSNEGAVEAPGPGDGEPAARKRKRRRRKRRTEPGAQVAGEEGATAASDAPAASESEAGAPSGSKPAAVRGLSAKEIDLAARAVQFLGKHAQTLEGALTPELQALLTQPAADRTIYLRLQDVLAQALASPQLAALPLSQRLELTTEALDACPSIAVFCAFVDAKLAEAHARAGSLPTGSGTEPSVALEQQATAQAEQVAEPSAGEVAARDDEPVGQIASMTGAPTEDTAVDAGSPGEASAALTKPGAKTRHDARTRLDVSELLEPLRRAEFAKVGKDVLQRWIEQSHGWVAPTDRLEWLCAALENKELKRALDQGEKLLPEPWQRLLPQARALSLVVLRGQTHTGGARVLEQGVRAWLRAGARGLLGRSPAIRERFCRVALEQRLPDAEARALGVVLESLRGEESALELELMVVRGLLSSGRHDKAEAELNKLLQVYGHRGPAAHWLKALGGPRFGQLALFKSRANPPVEHKNSLRPGFCFADQADVWVRVGDPEEAAQFLTQLDVHRRALVPCVAMVHESGFTNSRRPFIAYSRKGENAKQVLESPRGLERREALIFCRQLLHLGYALGRAGILLPDADLGRLELTAGGQLWLVESWGSKIDPAALQGMVDIARQWQLKLLSNSQRFELPRESRENLLHAADFETIRATLDSLWRNYYWAQ